MSYDLTGAAQGGNAVFSRAGGATANISALSGAATTFTIQNITFTVNGKMFFKATAAGAATPTTDANTGIAFKSQAANTACCYVFGLDATGTAKLAQGAITAYTDTTALSTLAPLPGIPDTMTPVSYVVIKNGATGTAWTIGTSNWNATGLVVDTPVDVGFIFPGVPLTA